MDKKINLPTEREEENWIIKKRANIKRFLIYTNQLKLISKYTNWNNKKILEYGCGDATLLSLIKLLAPGTELYGVEVSKTFFKYMPEDIRKKVFNISCGDRVPLKDKSVNIIISFDMIEHISSWKELEDMTEEWNKILKDDGFCIVATPNCSRIMKIIYFLTGNSYIYRDKYHKILFNDSKLKILLKKRFKHVRNLKGYDFNFFTKLLSKIGVYKHLCIIARK